MKFLVTLKRCDSCGWYVAGIVSWGYQCGATYGVYSQVSTFEDWILSTTGILRESRGCDNSDCPDDCNSFKLGDLHFFESSQNDVGKVYKDKNSEKYLQAIVNQDLGSTYKGWMVTGSPGDYTSVYYGTSSNNVIMCPTEYAVSKFVASSQTWTAGLSLNSRII